MDIYDKFRAWVKSQGPQCYTALDAFQAGATAERERIIGLLDNGGDPRLMLVDITRTPQEDFLVGDELRQALEPRP